MHKQLYPALAPKGDGQPRESSLTSKLAVTALPHAPTLAPRGD